MCDDELIFRLNALFELICIDLIISNYEITKVQFIYIKYVTEMIKISKGVQFRQDSPTKYEQA